MRPDVCNLTYKYMKENYDYLWLKTRLCIAGHLQENDTLIVGSSHALNGIDTYCFHNAINCSMHTQDIHYDYECVKRVIDKRVDGKDGSVPGKCFIIFGYYIPFQDISLGNGEYTQKKMRYVYNPVFEGQDDSTWECISEAISKESISQDDKNVIFQRAYDMVYVRRNYYNDLTVRVPLQKFEGKWRNLSEEQKMDYGRRRAADHNKHIKYTESYSKNQQWIKKLTGILHDVGTKTIIVIPPYTKAYIRYIDQDLIKATNELVNSTPNVEYLDMNVIDAGFCDDDFVDTDHLNGRGAYKLSLYLADKFGK